MISVLETMKTFSAEDGLTEEAIVTKLRTCRYHHLFLHMSLRHNASGLNLFLLLLYLSNADELVSAIGFRYLLCFVLILSVRSIYCFCVIKLFNNWNITFWWLHFNWFCCIVVVLVSKLMPKSLNLYGKISYLHSVCFFFVAASMHLLAVQQVSEA